MFAKGRLGDDLEPFRPHHRQSQRREGDRLLTFVDDGMAQRNPCALGGAQNAKRLPKSLRGVLNGFDDSFSGEIVVTPVRRTIVKMIAELRIFRRQPEAVTAPGSPFGFTGSADLVLEYFQSVFAEGGLVDENAGTHIRCHEQLEIVIGEPKGIVPTFIGDDLRIHEQSFAQLLKSARDVAEQRQ